MIIESNTGRDLTPFLMVGEMERRVGLIWDSVSICQRYSLLSNYSVYYSFNSFKSLPKELKKLVINKLT